MTIGEEVKAKILVRDREILRKGGSGAELARTYMKAKADGILEQPAEVFPKFASKFENAAQFAQIAADKATTVGSYQLNIDLGESD